MKSKMAKAEPNRATDLSDSDEPRFDMSITDNENSEPNLANPSTATLEPIRATDLSEREDPKCRKSNTASVLPRRE